MHRFLPLASLVLLSGCNLFTTSEHPTGDVGAESDADVNAITNDGGGDAGTDVGVDQPDGGVDADMSTGPGDFWVDITTGTDHSCALTSAGDAYCWGRGGDGRLGTGNETRQLVPTLVLGDHDFVAIDAGGRQTCALDRERALWCWGDGGDFGVVDGAPQFAPFMVDAGPMIQMSVGYDGVCVLDADSHARCIGDNDWGQLGIADPANATDWVDLGGAPLEAVDVSMGNEITCAIDTAGQTTCWGRDLSQAVDASGADGFLTQPITLPVALTDIEAGWRHVCGRDANRNTYCWGDAPLVSELTGGGTATTGGFLATPLLFDFLASGDDVSCALGEDGTAYCFGSNYRGRQGKGTDNSGGTPEPVSVIADGETFRDIDIASEHGCGITTDDRLLCWGQAYDGRLGNGQLGWVSTPQPADSAVTFTAVVAGDYHSCALADDGTMYCWGRGSYRALGLGNLDHQALPTPVPGHTFESIYAEASHSCGLTAAGEAWCWGSDSDGVLGNGSTDSTDTPGLVVAPEPFDAFDTGHNHACGILSSGQATCWGNRYDIGTSTGSNQQLPVALSTTDHPAYVQLAAGGRHSCGIDAAGVASCFGDNEEGQLGNGSYSQSRYVSVPVAGGLTFKLVRTAEEWSCGVASNDDLYCWGYGSRIGDGGSSDDTEPALVAGGKKWLDVSLGVSHNCGVTTGREIMCWGEGYRGRLGDGEDTTRYAPVEASLGEPGIAVAAGENHTCAIGISGQLYCWGTEEFGRLGNGTTSLRSTPVEVVVDGIPMP